MFIGTMDYREVWIVDFEFAAPAGERPAPICMVAWDIVSGRKIRLWQDDLEKLEAPPYPITGDCLMVAYYASAEIGCHLALGWAAPINILDLYVEFRCTTNGRETPRGRGLLGALAWFGLDSIAAVEKESMRQLALRGGPWTQAERDALLDYCESDVSALSQLFTRMLPLLDVPRALLRGRYMVAAAKMEDVGVPIDMSALATLRDNWTAIQAGLIDRIDRDYQVFEGQTFKSDRWASWLSRQKIPWPLLTSGALALDDDTFREMARVYPAVAPMRELRVSLSQMRLSDLTVGKDGRNRCLLSAFSSRTGRNQPSNSKFIFGPAVWLRGLIRPEPGHGLAYIDWAQQEFGIAAALSGDDAMIEAYCSGDPYLAFGKQAGAIPTDGTKQTHGSLREQFKACVLAVQYGMGAESLAARIAQPPVVARDLLQLHHKTYRRFWRWSDAAVDYAMLQSRISTAFGWTLHIGSESNSRSLRNFPMQANGAEMLRLACSYAIGCGIQICAPVHDAILIEAPLDTLQSAVEVAQKSMAGASAAVLGGFELRSEAKLIHFPDRYEDERGKRMWATVWEVVDEHSKVYPIV
ncbi:MAG: DNA polymerase I [Acidobacteriia bacterium]|nr:DNA polymerase I [Terriglobia bacterium]